MSYSACDFLESCEQMANDYGVPELSRDYWNSLGVDDEEVPEDEWEDYCNSEEGQRVLAERIGGALNARKQLLDAAKALLDTMETPRSERATAAWMKLQNAVKEAQS